MKPFVVDANVMNGFQKDRILGSAGPAQDAIEAILTASWIALDADGHCHQEWISCAGGQHPLALQDWLNDMLVRQKVRLYKFCTDSMHKELNGFGLPKKDHKWVRLAIGSSAAAIVTEDIDLFDPTKKGQPAAVVAKIKKSGSGKLAKHLNKSRGVSVVCCSTIPEFINLTCND